jgi:homoserine dehydrogenase
MAKVVVGMIGLGTVGTGVVRLLSQERHLTLKKVAVRDLARQRDLAAPCSLTANVAEVVDDPEIEVLIEVMGGEQPALDYIRRAISKRKHIVTANKEVLAKHGPELFKLARDHGVAIFFEASVAGGIPLISTIHKGLEANRISSVTGILNGTTNFILSRMEENNESFDSALAEAQARGFAEADPTNDVDGYDVSYKLCILSALAHGRFVRPESIYRQGIRKITAEDIAQARSFGYRIKLVGMTCRLDSGNGSAGEQSLAVRVHPMLVPLAHPLAAVSGSNNGIVVVGDAVGELTLVGPGAGQMPTASAVVGDTMNVASALMLPDFATYFHPEVEGEWARTADPGSWSSPYYLRLLVADLPGVIGQIGTIFGKHHISIQSIVQRGVQDNRAHVIIITQSVQSSNMESALADLEKTDFLIEVGNAIRIFQSDSTNA